jgi:hypothetical protein
MIWEDLFVQGGTGGFLTQDFKLAKQVSIS